jgi:3-hydroxyisobutyrate dehydrogenase-like beta-hydroxyacid dehydrogenase
VFETFSRKVAYLGGAGNGELTKLLNNALTITNMKNAADVLSIADQLGVDIPALLDVISISSGASFALSTLGHQVTPELAPHLRGLMRKDIEHFAVAVRARGIDPDEVRDRGLAGADGMVHAVGLVAGKAPSVAG